MREPIQCQAARTEAVAGPSWTLFELSAWGRLLRCVRYSTSSQTELRCLQPLVRDKEWCRGFWKISPVARSRNRPPPAGGNCQPPSQSSGT